jgi:hypothetical protein
MSDKYPARRISRKLQWANKRITIQQSVKVSVKELKLRWCDDASRERFRGCSTRPTRKDGRWTALGAVWDMGWKSEVQLLYRVPSSRFFALLEGLSSAASALLLWSLVSDRY